MKTRRQLFRILTLFFAFYSFGAFSHAQSGFGDGFKTPDGNWVWRNPHPFGGNFTSVDVLGSGYVIAGGDYAMIIYSDNHGENYADETSSWKQSEVPKSFTESVKDFGFDGTDNYKGFAISQNFLLKTVDKGETWNVDETLGDLGTAEYIAISAYNGSVYLLYKKDGNLAVSKSTAGGAWEDVTSIPTSDELIGMVYPYFWTSSNVYKESELIKTGLSDIVHLAPMGDEYLTISDEGFLRNNGSQATNLGQTATDDEGNTAIEAGFNSTDGRIIIFELSDGRYEVQVLTKHIYSFIFQNDGTVNYEQQTPPAGLVPPAPYNYPFDYTITDFAKVNKADGDVTRIALTMHSAIWVNTAGLYQPTMNAKKSIVEWARCVYFTDPMNGFIIQSDHPDEQITTTYRSEDGGVSWSEFAVLNQRLTDVTKFHVLPDHSKSFILTEEGKFYHQDLASGSHVPFLISENVKDFFFIDQLKGWYLDDERKLYVTNNSGDSWELYTDFAPILQPYESRAKIILNSVCFPNSETGFVGGQYGFILTTSDDGGEWRVVSQAGPEINAIQFVTEEIGFAGADDGKLFRCLDGGGKASSWEIISIEGTLEEGGTGGNLSVSDDIHNFQFWDDFRGYVVTKDGFVINIDSDIAGGNFFLKRSALKLPVGEKQKTPSMFVLNGLFERFIYAREFYVLTSEGFDTPGSYPTIIPIADENIPEFNDSVAPGNYSEVCFEYTIQVENLEGDLVVNAPMDFVISKTPRDESSWTTTLTFTVSEVVNGSITVYIAFHPEGTTTRGKKRKNARKSGQIVHMSNKAMSVKINVAGNIGDTGGQATPNYDPDGPDSINEIKKSTYLTLSQTINGTLNVTLQGVDTPQNAKIIDLSGRTIQQLTIEPGNQTIDIKHLQRGMYILSLENESGSISAHKFIR